MKNENFTINEIEQKLKRYCSYQDRCHNEVEKKLNFKVCPLSFPIGMGYDFQGVYNLWEKNIMLFKEENKQKISESIKINNIDDPIVKELVGENAANKLIEEIEIINEVYPNFSEEDYLNCKQQPVFLDQL